MSPIFPARALLAAAAFLSAAPVAAQDFTGAYVGGALSAGPSGMGWADWEGSAFIGHNWSFGGMIVAGAELDLTYNPEAIWGGTATITTLDARLGYLLADNILVYGRAGTGYTSALDGSYLWDLGAGGEYMLGNGLAIRGELDRVDPFEDGMASQFNGRLGVVMNF